MKPGLVLCLLLVALPLAAAEPPGISFESEAVLTSGITAKGQVLWFSVAREISRRSTMVVPRIEIQSDDDGDGAVRLELEQEVPLRSIWFAVDLATGESAVATPEGFPNPEDPPECSVLCGISLLHAPALCEDEGARCHGGHRCT